MVYIATFRLHTSILLTATSIIITIYLASKELSSVFTLQLFAEGEVIIGEYLPRRSRGEYSPIITEPEANNCFSINTQVIISKKRKKTFQREIIFTYSGKTTTGSHFVRRGDYRLIIRDSEPMRACDFV